MAICMIGIDHTRAGLDVRSVFSFTKKKTEQLYDEWRDIPGLHGCIVISTCNRMEAWFSVSCAESFSPLALLCSRHGVDEREYAPYFVCRKERDAVEHLFRLAAGMESRIVGEDQIITQVGDALSFARGCYATDNTLEVLFRLAVTAAKRVKTEASFSAADRSVIHTALNVLSDKGVSVRGKRCMVIGNGMMGRISAQALLDEGAEVTVTVRQYHSGVVDIPEGCERIGYEKRMEYLGECEFVVSATSSPNFTLTNAELSVLHPAHPVTIIDLAVPRDVDPEIANLEWATLYDIDSFHIDPRSEALQAAIARAQLILDEEEEHFYGWYEGRDFVPQIQRLKRAAGEDVSARMTPALRRARLGDERKEALSHEAAGASERMLNRMLFGMRAKLPDQVFRQCLDAMESVMTER